MEKRVDTKRKTADQSRHNEQGSAAAQARCHSGERLTEMLHAPSPASTPTGVPEQGVASGGGRGGAGGGGGGGGGGNGGTASARLPTSRGGARRHVGVVAAARRRRAGRLGWALIPGAPLATRESRACRAERHGDGRCRPRRRPLRLQPRRPERRPERAWGVGAAVGAAVGRLRRGRFPRRPSRLRPQRRQRAAATSCSSVAT